MIILIILLVVIAVIIAVPLIIAIFVKKEFLVERSIIINSPQPIVFNYVKFLKNQDYYSKWVMLDPALKKSFTGNDGTIGFIYAWEGNKQAGKGEQEIKAIEDGKQINMEIRFEKPFKSLANSTIITECVTESQTKVKWNFKGKNNYPLNFMNLFLGKMLGKDIDISLQNLKNIL